MEGKSQNNENFVFGTLCSGTLTLGHVSLSLLERAALGLDQELDLRSYLVGAGG